MFVERLPGAGGEVCLKRAVGCAVETQEGFQFGTTCRGYLVPGVVLFPLGWGAVHEFVK
jgi:hypothetical protein